MKITFIGHACFLIEHDNKTFVFDPFFVDEKKTLAAYPQIKNPDFILASHGHDDHIGSVFTIVGKNTTVVGMVELCSFLAGRGVEKTIGMNFGGTVALTKDVSVTIVRADHSSSFDGIYTGEPAGFIVRFGDETVYFSGDTGIFGDMKLLAELYKPTIGLICAGGRFTADKEAVLYACNNFFSFDYVIPMHYDTFPPIRTDMSDFSSRLMRGKAVLLKPFETFSVS